MNEIHVYTTGLLSDIRHKRVKRNLRHFLWDYAICHGRWRTARNYFNGYQAECEYPCVHSAGRGWTKRAALRRVNRIHEAATR